MKKIVLTISVGFIASIILVLMVETASAATLCNNRPGSKVTRLQNGAFAVCTLFPVVHVTTEEAVELAIDGNELNAQRVCRNRAYVEIRQPYATATVYVATAISYYTCR